MSLDLETISICNEWSLDFTEKISFEYERFLILRSLNSKLLPSDLIYKFWLAHILDTSSYCQYCLYRFNKIIDNNFIELLDQKLKNIRIAHTIIKYKDTFGNPIYPEIWLDNIKKTSFNVKSYEYLQIYQNSVDLTNITKPELQYLYIKNILNLIQI